MKNALIVIMIAILASCGTNNTSDSEKKKAPSKLEAIEMLGSVFTGSYSQQEIQENMDAVITLYKLSLSGENYLKTGNTLTSLRKSSNNGVSEMEIVTHMIIANTGWQGVSFDEQASESARSLEKKLAQKK